jgi:hypothetical protein
MRTLRILVDVLEEMSAVNVGYARSVRRVRRLPTAAPDAMPDKGEE